MIFEHIFLQKPFQYNEKSNILNARYFFGQAAVHKTNKTKCLELIFSPSWFFTFHS